MKMKNTMLSLTATVMLSLSGLASAASADADANATIDINTATDAQLRAVGFSKAQAAQIEELRQQDPFDNAAELKSEVKGVTSKSMAKLKGHVQVGADMIGGVVGSVAGATGGLLGAVGGAISSTAGAVADTGKRMAGSARASGVLDINTASADQLQDLGFSPDVATAIVADAGKDRIDNVKELKSEVPGVTDAMLAKLHGSLAIGSDMLSVLNNVSGSIKLNGCVNNPDCK